jgi:hypothetical protein
MISPEAGARDASEPLRPQLQSAHERRAQCHDRADLEPRGVVIHGRRAVLARVDTAREKGADH